MHLLPTTTALSASPATAPPPTELGTCLLCSPTFNTILLSQFLGLILIPLFLFGVLAPRNYPEGTKLYKLGQGLAIFWFLWLFALIAHATAKYYTDPWVYPFSWRRAESWKQEGVRLVVMGFNALFMVGSTMGWGLLIWVRGRRQMRRERARDRGDGNGEKTKPAIMMGATRTEEKILG